MATTAQLCAQDTRSESDRFMTALERDREWRCLWQVKTANGKRLVEFYFYPKANTYLVVIKDYETAIKQGKPWPKMIACQVYTPLDNSNTWGGLEKSLDDLEANANK